MTESKQDNGKGIGDIFLEAENELNQEAVKEAKSKYKRKLKERANIRKMLANCDRELALLKLEIQNELTP